MLLGGFAVEPAELAVAALAAGVVPERATLLRAKAISTTASSIMAATSIMTTTTLITGSYVIASFSLAVGGPTIMTTGTTAGGFAVQAAITGSPYWWSRYNACIGYY